MIAIVTLIAAFPLGYLLRSRIAANLTYAVAYLWAFTFQSVYLLLGTMSGEPDAFTLDQFPTDYGLVTAAVFAVGFGLVALGHWTASKRRHRQPDSVTARRNDRASPMAPA